MIVFSLVVLGLAIAFGAYQRALYFRIPSDGKPLFVEHGCAVWSSLWPIHHIDTIVVTPTTLQFNDVLGFLAYYRGSEARLHEFDLARIIDYRPLIWSKLPMRSPTNYEIRIAAKAPTEITFHLRVADVNGLDAALQKLLPGRGTDS